MRVAAIGDSCLDVYLEQDLVTIGGNALNVAANWSAAGIDSRYFGTVGSDRAARAIRDSVRALGMDEEDIRTLSGPSGVTVIRLVGNDRQFLYEEFGVGLEWRPSDDLLEELSSFDWVHSAGITPKAHLSQRLAARGIRHSVDLSTFHDFDSLEGVEIAFASYAGPLDSRAHDLAARMCTAGAETAVVMCGEHGSLARSGAETTTTRAQAITPVDTCGAGDSFIAAYVASHLHGNNVQTSLMQATSCATRTCLHIGSYRQQPYPVPDWVKQAYYQLPEVSA